MDVSAKAITGQLDASNRFCIDWNLFGTIAYSTQNTIHILDSYSMKIVQSMIVGKSSNVVKLKWSSVSLNDARQDGSNRLKLASVSDDSNTIYIWNVREGRLYQELVEVTSDKNVRVLDLKWVCNTDFLVAVYTDNKVVIWHCDKGLKISEKSFHEKIELFALDPHDFMRLALFGSNQLIFLNADNTHQSHEPIVRKFSLASNEIESLGLLSSPSSSSLAADLSKKTINLFSNWKTTARSSSERASQNECVQVEFHANLKNILLLVYSREIFIFDLVINQTVGCIQIDRTQSSVIQIYSCSQTDGIYTLHENGSITFYSRLLSATDIMLNTKGTEQFSNKNLHHSYWPCSQSDQIRSSKNNLIFGFSVCPTSERNIIILNSDGRIMKYEIFYKKNLKDIDKKKEDNEPINELFLSEISSPKKVRDLKITLVSMHTVLPTQFLVKISPIFNNEDKSSSRQEAQLLAVGCMTGALFIYDIVRMQVRNKFAIFNNPVVGIEWCTKNSLILWSHSIANSAAGSFQSHDSTLSSSQSLSSISRANLVKNEIVLIDIRTGQSVNLRKGHEEESIITSIKVSNMRQYLIILFKEQPLEIWDLKNFALIKKISRKSPHMTVLEWYSHDLNEPTRKSTSDVTFGAKKTSSDKEDTVHKTDESKESFICIDHTGLIYSLTIESNHIRDGQLALPEDVLYANVRAMDFKRELMIFGDAEGSITRFNARTRQTRAIQVRRNAEIKRIRFTPAHDSLLISVQFTDCVDVLDASSVTLDVVCTLKSENAKIKIVDSCWFGPDRLLVQFSNHTLRVFNITPGSKSSSYFSATRSINLFTSVSNAEFGNDELDETGLIKFKNTLLSLFEREGAIDEKGISLPVGQLNSCLAAFLKHESTKTSKLQRLCDISAYFNSKSFETRFWSLLLYEENHVINNVVRQSPLLMSAKDFREVQKEVLKIYHERCELSKLVKSNVLTRDLYLINELDHVFNLLIDTEPRDDDYAFNMIKAGLITTFKNASLDTSTRTSLKLIGTNLIAHGKLFEGVELLCLIGLVFDACRYLQDNNQWAKAAWLAKMRLNEEEYTEVIKRWCEHVLCSNHFTQKEFAILLLVNCKQYLKALDILSETNYVHLSILFLKHCIENKLISDEKFTCQPNSFCSLDTLAGALLESDTKSISKIARVYLESKSPA